MKKTLFFITLILTISMAGDLMATKPTPSFRFVVRPITHPIKAGLVKMIGTASASANFNNISIVPRKIINLEYIGEKSFDFDIKAGETKEFYFDVIIPENDTSGITFIDSVSSVDGAYGPVFFVTSEDTVKVLPSDPRREYNIDLLPKKEEHKIFRLIPGEFPHLDSIYGVPDSQPAIETQFAIDTLTDYEINLVKIREKEKYVLTDKPYEIIHLSDEPWRRNKGEQYFKKMEPITDFGAFTRNILDSIRALPEDHLFEMCIEITTDEVLKKVQEIYGELPEEIEKGFYHIKITMSQIDKLLELKIAVRPSNQCRHFNYQKSSDSSKKNFKN